MIDLIWGNSFKRAYKKTLKAKPHLRNRIIQCLELFTNDPFHPSLNTHKLSGKLKDFWALVVEDDCRIVFKFLEDGTVILIDIGKHDEVY